MTEKTMGERYNMPKEVEMSRKKQTLLHLEAEKPIEAKKVKNRFCLPPIVNIDSCLFYWPEN